MAEAGFPDFEIVTWYGMVAPAGTPRELITRLNTEIARILELPDTRERLASLGAQPMGGSAEQFDAYIKSESVKFGKIVRALNLQVD
jgi:tripartite-type tricarboxylate transporter receptor subunit TctC